MAAIIQVHCTIDSRKGAEKIANALVAQKLSSCVQVLGPIRSTYRWRGKIEHASEWLCIIKARRRAYTKIEAAIKRIHPYEVIEVLAVPIIRGNREYLSWVSAETAPMHRV